MVEQCLILDLIFDNKTQIPVKNEIQGYRARIYYCTTSYRMEISPWFISICSVHVRIITKRYYAKNEALNKTKNPGNFGNYPGALKKELDNFSFEGILFNLLRKSQ